MQRLPRRLRASAPDPKVMSFIEHLEELRRRLIVMIATVILGSILGWFLYPHVFKALESPLVKALSRAHQRIHKPIVTKLYGAFTLHLKVAILIGIVIAIPILLQQLWGFIAPALPTRLYRSGPWVISCGILLFVLGGLTGYEIMPLAINFFVGQAGGNIVLLADAMSYISFVALIIVVFGVSFEMPLVLVMLCLASITSSGWLWRKRVIAFFVIFFVSAIITPGADWISPLVLGAILYVLFLGSLVVAKALGH
jgi:sec-independent protein translocase protein TatC